MARHSPNISVMVRAAEKAGRSLARDFGEVEQLQVSQKGPGDFVSAADRRAEEIIFENLSRDRPDYGFLMEERGEDGPKDYESRFIVDPLDGTSNFLHGLPHWAVSIALEEKGQIVAGIVYDPIKDDLFTAEKGQGAFKRRQRLRVSGRTGPLASVVGTGAPQRARENHERFFAEQYAIWKAGMSLRRFGSASLDLAYVAAGLYEGFWERDLQVWDVAAGLFIVQEAGGFICDLDDDRKNPYETANVLAANESVFQEMKTILRNVET